MTPSNTLENLKESLEYWKQTPSKTKNHTEINYLVDTLANAIAIFSALEKADFKNGIIHESSIGKIVINSLGTIESEGDLGEAAIADYLNWESQVMTHLDATEVLVKWDADEEENNDPDFPDKVGFTSVGFNYMKLLPY